MRSLKRQTVLGGPRRSGAPAPAAWAHGVLGALLLCTLPGLYAIWGAFQVTGIGFLAEASRMIEGAALPLLLVNLIIVLLLALLRFRRMALAVLLLCLAGAATLTLRIAQHSTALVPGPAAIQVVWWNAYNRNPTEPQALLEALSGLEAEVVILGEAYRTRPILTALAETYPYQMGCGTERCSMLVLSQLPLKAAGDFDAPFLGSNGWFRSERLSVFRVETPQGPLNIAAMHMTKAWYGAARRAEGERLRDSLDRIDGPLLLVGDFNAPPWGEVLAHITTRNQLKTPWPPRATWPADLGPLGLPIDYAMVRDGAGVTNLESLFGDLGSNHRGLRIGVQLSF